MNALGNKSNCFEHDLFPLAGYSIWVQAYRQTYLSTIYLFIHSGHSNCNILFNAMWMYMVAAISGGNSVMNARSNDWNVNCMRFAWISNDAYAACARKFTFVCQPLDVSIVLPPFMAPCGANVCLLLLPLHLLNIYDCRPEVRYHYLAKTESQKLGPTIGSR